MKLQIVFFLASLFTFFFIIRKIIKHKLNIDDSIIWILWALILLVFSVFPQIPNKISEFLGFMSPSNFILSLFLFFTYIILFFQNIELSNLKQKNRELIQKLSLMNYAEKDK